MKKLTPVLVLSSLLIGGVLTMLFAGQMEWSSSKTVCSTSVLAEVKNTKDEHAIEPLHESLGSTCSTLEMGYPKRFLFSRTDLEVQKIIHTDINLKDVRISSMPDINIPNLIFNWGVWTLVSGVVLFLTKSLYGINKAASKKVASKKKR